MLLAILQPRSGASWKEKLLFARKTWIDNTSLIPRKHEVLLAWVCRELQTSAMAASKGIQSKLEHESIPPYLDITYWSFLRDLLQHGRPSVPSSMLLPTFTHLLKCMLSSHGDFISLELLIAAKSCFADMFPPYRSDGFVPNYEYFTPLVSISLRALSHVTDADECSENVKGVALIATSILESYCNLQNRLTNQRRVFTVTIEQLLEPAAFAIIALNKRQGGFSDNYCVDIFKSVRTLVTRLLHEALFHSVHVGEFGSALPSTAPDVLARNDIMTSSTVSSEEKGKKKPPPKYSYPRLLFEQLRAISDSCEQGMLATREILCILLHGFLHSMTDHIASKEKPSSTKTLKTAMTSTSFGATNSVIAFRIFQEFSAILAPFSEVTPSASVLGTFRKLFLLVVEYRVFSAADDAQRGGDQLLWLANVAEATVVLATKRGTMTPECRDMAIGIAEQLLNLSHTTVDVHNVTLWQAVLTSLAEPPLNNGYTVEVAVSLFRVFTRLRQLDRLLINVLDALSKPSSASITIEQLFVGPILLELRSAARSVPLKQAQVLWCNVVDFIATHFISNLNIEGSRSLSVLPVVIAVFVEFVRNMPVASDEISLSQFASFIDDVRDRISLPLIANFTDVSPVNTNSRKRQRTSVKKENNTIVFASGMHIAWFLCEARLLLASGLSIVLEDHSWKDYRRKVERLVECVVSIEAAHENRDNADGVPMMLARLALLLARLGRLNDSDDSIKIKNSSTIAINALMEAHDISLSRPLLSCDVLLVTTFDGNERKCLSASTAVYTTLITNMSLIGSCCDLSDDDQSGFHAMRIITMLLDGISSAEVASEDIADGAADARIVLSSPELYESATLRHAFVNNVTNRLKLILKGNSTLVKKKRRSNINDMELNVRSANHVLQAITAFPLKHLDDDDIVTCATSIVALDKLCSAFSDMQHVYLMARCRLSLAAIVQARPTILPNLFRNGGLNDFVNAGIRLSSVGVKEANPKEQEVGVAIERGTQIVLSSFCALMWKCASSLTDDGNEETTATISMVTNSLKKDIDNGSSWIRLGTAVVQAATHCIKFGCHAVLMGAAVHGHVGSSGECSKSLTKDRPTESRLGYVNTLAASISEMSVALCSREPDVDTWEMPLDLNTMDRSITSDALTALATTLNYYHAFNSMTAQSTVNPSVPAIAQLAYRYLRFNKFAGPMSVAALRFIAASCRTQPTVIPSDIMLPLFLSLGEDTSDQEVSMYKFDHVASLFDAFAFGCDEIIFSNFINDLLSILSDASCGAPALISNRDSWDIDSGFGQWKSSLTIAKLIISSPQTLSKAKKTLSRATLMSLLSILVNIVQRSEFLSGNHIRTHAIPSLRVLGYALEVEGLRLTPRQASLLFGAISAVPSRVPCTTCDDLVDLFNAQYHVLSAVVHCFPDVVLQKLSALISAERRLCSIMVNVIEAGYTEVLPLENFARLIEETATAAGKPSMKHIAPYLLADLVNVFQTAPLSVAGRKALSVAVYSLLDTCSADELDLLYVGLETAAQSVLRILHDDYIKYHKFDGRF